MIEKKFILRQILNLLAYGVKQINKAFGIHCVNSS